MNNAFTSGWTGGQYSLCRWVTGAFFAGWFGSMALAAFGGTPPTGRAYSLPIFAEQLSPLLTGPTAFAIVGLIGAPAGLLLIAGRWKPIVASLLLLLSLLYLDARSTFWPMAATVLFLHAATPAAVWGRWGSRPGEVGHDWRLPRWIFAGAWIALAAFFVTVSIRMLQLATASEVSAPGFSGWIAAALWPLSLFRRTRPILWLLYLAFGAMLMVRGAAAFVWGPYALTMMLAMDPGWIPALRGKPGDRLYYDGDCGMCHSAVEFVLSEDRNDPPIQMAPLDSESFRKTISEQRRATLPDSMFVCDDEGTLRMQSEGVLYLGRRMGGFWRLGAEPLRWIPRPLRDAGYDALARIRHRVFRRPTAACPVVPAELRSRFED